MEPKQLSTRTICGLNKCFLNYRARNNCATKQTDPEQIGRK